MIISVIYCLAIFKLRCSSYIKCICQLFKVKIITNRIIHEILKHINNNILNIVKILIKPTPK